MKSQVKTIPAPEAAFGDQDRFVRPFDVRRERFIEFHFEVGDEDMSVELVMPVREFLRFCERQDAYWLEPESDDIREAVESLAEAQELTEDLHTLMGRTKDRA